MVGWYCTTTYHKFSAYAGNGIEKSKLYYIGAGLILIITMTLFLYGNAMCIGFIGCTLAVCLMGSPLAALNTVLATRSTESMPFLTSLSAFFNSLSWSLYGLLVSYDPMIYTPNLIGLAVTSVQMALFLKFGVSDFTGSSTSYTNSNTGGNCSALSSANMKMTAMPTKGSLEV